VHNRQVKADFVTRGFSPGNLRNKAWNYTRPLTALNSNGCDSFSPAMNDLAAENCAKKYTCLKHELFKLKGISFPFIGNF